MGKNHKALSAFNLKGIGFFPAVLGVEDACSGDAVMEQIMISGSGAEGMRGIALFPAELIQTQIYKIFIWKDREDNFTHKILLLSLFCSIIYQNAA